MLDRPNLQPIEDWVKYYIQFHKISSISIGFADLTSIQTLSFGLYDLENHISADVNSAYNIASLSKIYTIIEILRLEEEKTISLSDAVSKYISSFSDKNITINDLILHTAGLTRDGEFNFWLTEKFPSDKELIKSLEFTSINNSKKYKYSNLGYALLGVILKKFNINLEQKFISNVKGYGKELINERKIYNFIDHKSFTSSFGLYKNINEMTDFTQKLLLHELSQLTIPSWNKIYSVQLEREKDQDDLTIGLTKWKNENIFEFSGYGFGFASGLLIDNDNKLAYCILTNTSEENLPINFTHTIRRYVNYFKENEHKINFNSSLNGLYRSKDYDILLYDCSDKLYLIKPAESNPFHPDNCEIYTKVADNKYLITKKENDPYINEILTFEFGQENTSIPIGFHQGGWGFKKTNID